MKTKITASFYHRTAEKIRRATGPYGPDEELNLGRTVRRIREEKMLSGAELCRRAGDLDPRTLTAIEKGRIKNPSIQSLKSIARALGVMVSNLFQEAEIEEKQNFYQGSQKGFYQVEFPSLGIKVVSFTPRIRDFFCGKLILGAHRKLEDTLLDYSMPIYVSALVGRIEVTVEERKTVLKEGDNLFFNGLLKHSFVNPLHRDSVLLMITAPSFL